ncbi:MAG TPA: hypothetical protein VIF37_18055 [Methylobacter sp.]
MLNIAWNSYLATCGQKVRLLAANRSALLNCPLPSPAAPDFRQINSKPAEGSLRILVVDDNPMPP